MWSHNPLPAVVVGLLRVLGGRGGLLRGLPVHTVERGGTGVRTDTCPVVVAAMHVVADAVPVHVRAPSVLRPRARGEETLVVSNVVVNLGIDGVIATSVGAREERAVDGGGPTLSLDGWVPLVVEAVVTAERISCRVG